MSLVQILWVLAILVTFTGSYRLFTFFFSDDPVFGGLIALAITVAFLVVFEYLLLTLGIITILSPLGILYRYREKLPGAPKLPGLESARTSEAQTHSSETVTCSHCGTINDKLNRHCDDCGRLLLGDS